MFIIKQVVSCQRQQPQLSLLPFPSSGSDGKGLKGFVEASANSLWCLGLHIASLWLADPHSWSSEEGTQAAEAGAALLAATQRGLERGLQRGSGSSEKALSCSGQKSVDITNMLMLGTESIFFFFSFV